MKELTVKELYDLNETIAKDIFDGVTYPWEVLPKIGDFILELGNTLPKEEYDQVGENVWIAKSANVFPSAYIHGPAIIGKNAEVRHCAFIRGNAIVGEYRFLIIIMWEILCLDIKRIWVQVPLHQM